MSVYNLMVNTFNGFVYIEFDQTLHILQSKKLLSFIQITAKHSPRSQDCKDLPALKINLSASQLFQVQIPVISVVTASDGSDAETKKIV